MLLQQLINGVTLGSIYALVAIGYTMVYGILQLINFAHGEILMMGAFFAITGMTLLHLDFFTAILMAMVLCTLLGMAIEFLAYRKLRNSPPLTVLISALGVSIFLQNLAMIIWGTHPLPLHTPFDGIQWNVGGVTFSLLQVAITATSASLMIALHFFVQKTILGKAMRATAEDRSAASLMGIPVNQMISLAFAIGSALAAIAGVMVGAYYHTVYPTMGYFTGLKAFAAAVLGGIGNIPGAMLGGLLLGIVEIMGVAVGVPSGYQDAISFGILILVLLFRPHGLLGEQLPERA